MIYLLINDNSRVTIFVTLLLFITGVLILIDDSKPDEQVLRGSSNHTTKPWFQVLQA